MFARSIFMVFPVFAVLLTQGSVAQAVATKTPWLHVSRMVTGVISMFCTFAALIYLPLPDATAIAFAAPLFTVILSALILKENVRVYRWLAVSAGFCGILLIFSPHIMHTVSGAEGGSALLGSLLALGGAVFSAFSMISVRNMAKTERAAVIVFYFAIGSAMLSLLSLPFGWIRPTPLDGILLVIIGLTGGVMQILTAQSYRYAEASTLAPFDYVVLLWAIVFGWLFFSDVPSWQMLLGAGIVIASGIYVIWRAHGEIVPEPGMVAKT